MALAGFPQPSISSIRGKQFVVGAAFGDPAVVEHDDLVGSGDGVQSMSDHQHRTVSGQPVERLLDKVFRFRIGVRCGLVEDEDRCVGEDGTGDGEPLPFPPESPLPAPSTVS